MATVSAWEADSLSDVTGGAVYFATLAVGDNGYPDGVPTASVGADGEATAWLAAPWDSNLDDGFDSGWVDVRFSVNVGQGGSLDASHAGSLAFDTVAPSTIGSVTIQAAVAGAGMQMCWSNVAIEFYSGGTLVETVAVGGVVADTMDQAHWAPEESVVTVATNAPSGYDGIVVTAKVRLMTAEGIYPSAADVFGQIAIS